MDLIEVANLISSTVTAVSALFIAFVALQQSARPNIDVRMKGELLFPASTECIFMFEVVNVGHWYASPAAIGVNVYPNFDQSFVLRECRYGSMQELVNTHVRHGKGGMTFVRAKRIKLSHRYDAEGFDVVGTTPATPGRYQVIATAISENGAACHRKISIEIEVAAKPLQVDIMPANYRAIAQT